MELEAVNAFLAEVDRRAPVLFPVLMAALGAVFGSFLTCMVYRVPRGIGLAYPPSACPVCQARLAPVDLVPVLSWLAFRGRCRHCRAPISPRYPLIEVLSTALGLLAWGLAGPSVALPPAFAALIGLQFCGLLWVMEGRLAPRVLLFSCIMAGFFALLRLSLL